MNFDIFLSLCQAEVDGFKPNERTMFANFFDQVRYADALGFEIAWVGESHFSSEVQKANPGAVIPHFKGEIALNTDALHLAHRIFAETRQIEVGSAIRNILCNGGPLAHAEAIRMFLSVHGYREEETRRLHIGFASGRFPYANRPYGISPRNEVEALLWPIVKGKLFHEATEVFLRALRGDAFSSLDIPRRHISRTEVAPELWQQLVQSHGSLASLLSLRDEKLELAPWWQFDKLAIVPRQAPLPLLNLVVGSHDPQVQELANQYFPCWVFNLSITPCETIERTHTHMAEVYAQHGRTWQRGFLPQTSLVFLNADPQLSPKGQQEKARAQAEKTLTYYWQAMQGTISQDALAHAMSNALWGNPAMVAEQIQSRFHKDDRLMLWFDFYCHDNASVKNQMRLFCDQVRPLLP